MTRLIATAAVAALFSCSHLPAYAGPMGDIGAQVTVAQKAPTATPEPPQDPVIAELFRILGDQAAADLIPQLSVCGTTDAVFGGLFHAGYTPAYSGSGLPRTEGVHWVETFWVGGSHSDGTVDAAVTLSEPKVGNPKARSCIVGLSRGNFSEIGDSAAD
jgi:hypothetical protein